MRFGDEGVPMGSPDLADAARESVALVFVTAGLIKLRDPRQAAASIHELMRLPTWIERSIPHLLAMSEIGAGAALLFATTRLYALPAVLLLALFSVFLVALERRAPSAPCGCLGDIGSTSHVAGLARNVALGALLVVAASQPPDGLNAGALLPAIQFALLIVLLPEGFSLLRRLHGMSIRR